MLLIAGLGNPEPQYRHNRHNIGFMVIDALAAHFGFAPFQKKFHALASEGRIENEKILLLKPQNNVNRSGIAIAEAAQFFKLSGDNIIVFYDELDLPPGKLRMKKGGGLAGHNGLKSIKAHCGADFRRARLGIGHPGYQDAVTKHVLGDFSKQDDTWLTPLLESLVRHAPLLVAAQDATYQNRVHDDMQPQDQHKETE